MPDTYAVIFSSRRTALDDGYDDTAELMVELAQQQPGFQGVESTRGPEGLGITVSYWDSLEAIQAWKRQIDHRAAQRRGRLDWYSEYHLRVCKLEYERHYVRESEETGA